MLLSPMVFNLNLDGLNSLYYSLNTPILNSPSCYNSLLLNISELCFKMKQFTDGDSHCNLLAQATDHQPSVRVTAHKTHKVTEEQAFVTGAQTAGLQQAVK